jgi:hypothetical protein
MEAPMTTSVTKIGSLLRISRDERKGENSLRVSAKVGLVNSFTGKGYTRGFEPSLIVVLDKTGAKKDAERSTVLYEHEIEALRDFLNAYFPAKTEVES